MPEPAVMQRQTPDPENDPEAGDARPRQPEAAEASAIVLNKVKTPVLPPAVVHRARLLGWLDEKTRQRVVVVTAEAGFGKTTLLADFSRHTKAVCVWYRTETSDRDWITFLGYLVAAIGRHYSDFGAATDAMLRHVASMAPSRDVVVSTFLSDLDALPGDDVLIILDDLHNTEGSDDAAHIVGRLIENAPSFVHLILSGRSRPELPLVRVASQGRLSTLGTSDLRFSRAEIEELFTTQGQPMRSENCDVIEERTEGWVASLQLISASIASSRSDEVDIFINALSGAKGSLYDFLAEEVLSRLSQASQRVLVHASLVDPVRPEYVTAILSLTPEPVPLSEVDTALDQVASIGLLTPGQESSDGARLHPLLREFLERELTDMTDEATVAAMHVAVARTAEETDWLASAKHYAAGSEPEEAMRVLGKAAVEALGGGGWGAATELIESMPDGARTPAVQIIRARAHTAEDDPETALGVLDSIDETALEEPQASALHLARASALHASGRNTLVHAALDHILESPESPEAFRNASTVWVQLLAAADGGSIVEASKTLIAVVPGFEASGLEYFAAVALNNAATCELARGEYAAAGRLATSALSKLRVGGIGADIVSSVQMLRATASAEAGDWRRSIPEAVAVARRQDATADAIADAAYLSALVGNLGDARYLVARLDRGDAPGSSDAMVSSMGSYARAAIALAGGGVAGFTDSLPTRQIGGLEVDGPSRSALLDAMAATLGRAQSAVTSAAKAVDTISRQNAWRWASRAQLVLAAAQRDGPSLRTWVEETVKATPLAVYECANVIALNLDLLDPIPAALEASIVEAPERWIPTLSQQLVSGDDRTAKASARLLARYGGMDDAAKLRAYEESTIGPTKRRGYVAELIRRVSPTARVHDLGPTTYEVGNRVVAVSEQRRRPASLLAFLITRAQLTATKEQVMEGLWPDQGPESAVNSLHQTLFFLRRDIEPWYEDGSTADYVRMESDLVFLDSEMFQVDSIAFARQATEAVGRPNLARVGPPLLGLYNGRFAPEFEYEDWAEEWRNHVHGAYLHLAHATARELERASDIDGAINILTNAVGLDALAFDLRSSLIRCLARAGSIDAARMHYNHLASLHRQELGAEPEAFESLLQEVPP